MEPERRLSLAFLLLWPFSHALDGLDDLRSEGFREGLDDLGDRIILLEGEHLDSVCPFDILVDNHEGDGLDATPGTATLTT